MTRSVTLCKANTPEFLTVDDLIGRVKSGSRISIGGHHFARLPMAMIRKLAARNLSDLNYTSWAGGLPLEFLLEANSIAEINICFSSLDIFGLAPKFRKAIEKKQVVMHDWPALALISAFQARAQNLPFLPMQIPQGSSMFELCPGMRLYHDAEAKCPIALVNAVEIDFFLMHAPRADTAGNVEIFGAHALDKVQVGASANVFVTVDEIVPAGTLNASGRSVIIPRNKITAIAEKSGGAYPCSCLPYYTTDWAKVRELAEVTDDSLLARANEIGSVPPLDLKLAAGLPAASITSEKFEPCAIPSTADASVDEIMAVRISKTLDNNSYASAGAVSPLGNVAYRLAKNTHAPNLIITTFSGGHVDIAPGPISLSLVEAMDADSALYLTGGEDTYWSKYQGGFVTSEIVGTAQIDGQGRTNTLQISKPSGGILRLPGQGGMADVANMHRDFVVYVPRHSTKSLVNSVEVVSACRGIISDKEREEMGYRPGKVLLFTNLCVFEFDHHTGKLVVVEIMPDISREQIIENTGFEVSFDKNCTEVASPTADELFILRHHVDPIGLRRLEFVAANERAALLDDIIARDRAVVANLVQDLKVVN